MFRNGEFDNVVCGICGAAPPKMIDRVADPVGKHLEARANGFDWVLIRSGMNPVYEWQCETCRSGRDDFFERARQAAQKEREFLESVPNYEI